METSETSPKPIESPEPKPLGRTRSVTKRGVAKGVGRVVAAGLIGGTMSLGSPTPVGAEGGIVGWLGDRKNDFGGLVHDAFLGPNPTPTDLQRKQAQADAAATQVSAEATKVKEIQKTEEQAAKVKASSEAVNAVRTAAAFTKTPTPTPTKIPTGTPTPTLSPDVVATEVAVAGTKAAEFATQAALGRQLTDARATMTAGQQEVNVAFGAPTLTPTPASEQITATAQARLQATSDAIRESVQRTAIAEKIPSATPAPAATPGTSGGPKLPPGEGIKVPKWLEALGVGAVYAAYRGAVRKAKGNWGLRGGAGFWKKLRGWVLGFK